jgi:hypothetical protein
MGNLKPIGSEKLQGLDKIRRIIEISNYNLNTPKSINEDSSNEYKKTLADGNTYHIVKEKSGYVIKKGLNESVAEYIEPIKNRKFYPSYSQALKRLNIITKEVNIVEGQVKNLSLFNESEDMEYYLDLEEQETTPAPAQAPVPAGPPAPAEPTIPEPEIPTEEPMPEPEMPPMDEEGEDDEEMITMKSVQKATGKLAQKIRAFLGNEENEMTSEDTKYVINSILSALDLSSLDDEDLDEIMSKFEGEEGGEEEMGSEEGLSPEIGGEMGGEMSPEEMSPEPPVAPEGGEMAEYRLHGARKNRHMQKMEEMFEDIFSESKIDKVLSKYFVEQTPKKQDRTITKIQNLAESFKQEVKSVKLYEKYNNSKFLGKNKYGQLVFEMNDKRIRVNPNGEIL